MTSSISNDNYSIGSGTSCFLIKDKRLRNYKSYFYTWLHKQGYKKWPQGHGWYNSVDCIYHCTEKPQKMT